MLEKNDLQQIKGVVKEVVETAIENTVPVMIKKGIEDTVPVMIGEVLADNVIPALDNIHTRLDVMQKQIDRMPDRDYIDRVVGKSQAVFVEKLRTEDKKVNLHTKFLVEQEVFTEEHVTELKTLKVFPATE